MNDVVNYKMSKSKESSTESLTITSNSSITELRVSFSKSKDSLNYSKRYSDISHDDSLSNLTFASQKIKKSRNKKNRVINSTRIVPMEAFYHYSVAKPRKNTNELVKKIRQQYNNKN